MAVPAKGQCSTCLSRFTRKPSSPGSSTPHTIRHYLMHAIMVRIAYGERDGARLKKRYLENVMGRWACQPILECLRESGEIQRRGQYIPGSQCFLYLPAEHYRHQKLRRVRADQSRSAAASGQRTAGGRG